MNNQLQIWCSNTVLTQIGALANDQYPLETGGMLIGYQSDNHDIVVMAAIGPGLNAKHSVSRFIPDAVYQQHELEQQFYTSKGINNYLGDWHTHPDGKPCMSWLDKRTLAHIAETPSSQTKNPIMMILGGGLSGWEVRVHRFISRTGIGWLSLYQNIEHQIKRY